MRPVKYFKQFICHKMKSYKIIHHESLYQYVPDYKRGKHIIVNIHYLHSTAIGREKIECTEYRTDNTFRRTKLQLRARRRFASHATTR